VRPISRAVLTYIAYFSAVGAAFPYLPVYYRGLGLDLGVIGVIAGLSAATQLVAAPAWGGLTDRFPRSRLSLPAAALVAAGGALGLATARDLATVVPSAFVLAFGLAGIGPVLDARTLDILGADKIRYGQLRAWGSVAFVVVAALVGVLLDAHGVGALFLVYVPALVLTALIGATLPRTGTTRGASVFRGAWAFVTAPGMRLFLSGSLLVWALVNAVSAFYSIQVVALGAPQTTVGLAWAIGSVIEVPIMFLFPRLAVRFGTERLLVVGAAAFAIRAAAAAAATDPVTLVLIAPVEGVGFAFFFVGGVTFVAHRAPAGLAATAQGVYTAVSGLAAILGAGLGGLAAGAAGIPAMFAGCAIGGVGATLVMAFAAFGRPLIEVSGPAGRPEREGTVG
jgi:PPP family 3-phenylpropionic acid transporter